MPTKSTVRKAKQQPSRAKRSSTAASELVREDIAPVRTGKRRGRSSKRAVAIVPSGRKRRAPSRKRTGAPRNRLAANRSAKRSR